MTFGTLHLPTLHPSRRRMSKHLLFALLVLTLTAVASVSSFSQDKGKGNDKAKVKPLPNDPDLLALHRDFVKEAEKLAIKYEKDKQWSKAKDCYVEILKLTPQYPIAKQKVQQLLQMEAQANNVVITLKANEPYRDTGVVVMEDRPFTITATGTWTFTLKATVGPQGLKIPEELREFDPGCLVGMIVGIDGERTKPFMVGTEKQMLAPKTGRLFLQMYDNDVRDNEGELTIDIRGTFQADDFKPSKKDKDK